MAQTLEDDLTTGRGFDIPYSLPSNSLNIWPDRVAHGELSNILAARHHEILGISRCANMIIRGKVIITKRLRAGLNFVWSPRMFWCQSTEQSIAIASPL
jgi:hypothetical protein